MLDVGIFSILFDKTFLATAAAAIIAFAAIVTLGLPMLERNPLDKRLKAVAERREELRQRHHESLNKRGSLRSTPISSNRRIRAKSSPRLASAARGRSSLLCSSVS